MKTEVEVAGVARRFVARRVQTMHLREGQTRCLDCRSWGRVVERVDRPWTHVCELCGQRFRLVRGAYFPEGQLQEVVRVLNGPPKIAWAIRDCRPVRDPLKQYGQPMPTSITGLMLEGRELESGQQLLDFLRRNRGNTAAQCLRETNPQVMARHLAEALDLVLEHERRTDAGDDD